MRQTQSSILPVIIHQMGKVASQSIEATLRNTFPQNPIFRTHMLTNSTWNNVSRWLACPPLEIQQEYRKSWINQIEEGKRIRRQIEDYKRLIDAGFVTQKLNVVTAVREPVAITVACLFQSLTLHFPMIDFRCKIEPADKIAVDVRKYFLHCIKLFFNKQSMPKTPQLFQFQSWLTRRPQFFDDELKAVFEVDVYKKTFDRSRGFHIYESKYARVLLIRVEDLNRVVTAAFNAFLGIESFNLINKNVGSQKFYKDLYAEFKKVISFPETFIDYHYLWKFARHFYSIKELSGFRRKWRRETSKDQFSNTTANDSGIRTQSEGEVLIMQGDAASALKLSHESIKCEPAFATAHNNLGVVAWQNGNRKAATQHFQRAIKLAPDYGKAVINAGQAFLERGLEEKALNLYLAYFERHPGDRDIAAAIKKLAGHKTYATNLPSTTLNSIDKDAIVIVIDISNSTGQSSSKALNGCQGYYEKNMSNLISLLEYCNQNAIKVQEARYFDDGNRRLSHIKFDYNLKYRLDYRSFSHIFFCGSSLDQCVVSRPLGYFNIDHPKKTLLRNCSFQGYKFCLPVDYGIKKLPYRPDGVFNSMVELENHIDIFLIVNMIKFKNWLRPQKIGRYK